jgi:hypothetical protein
MTRKFCRQALGQGTGRTTGVPERLSRNILLCAAEREHRSPFFGNVSGFFSSSHANEQQCEINYSAKVGAVSEMMNSH